MKTLATVTVLLSLAFLPGCNDSNSKLLTTKKAQNAVDQIKKGGGAAIVNGVRSEQVMGATVVDVTLTNYGYTASSRQFKTYTGPAEVIFQGYTDGRWTVKEMSFSVGTGVFSEKVTLEINMAVQ